MILMGIDLPLAAIRRQLASGLDIMVHLGRMRDKTRKVLEILEINGYDMEKNQVETRTLFSLEEQTGILTRQGELSVTGKLKRAGLYEEGGEHGEAGL